jgi:Sec-independent protein translocase protein TatA
MEILNIGPLELIIILVLMFVVLGPKQMVVTAYRIGSWIRGFVRSPMWKEILGYSMEIRELPQKLMDETGLKETLEEVRQSTQEATNELNQTVNEAVEAARVPEAEHLRVDANAAAVDAQPQISEVSEQTQTIAPPDLAEAALEQQSAVSEVGLEPDASAAGVLPAAVEEQPVKKTRRKRVVDDQPADEQPVVKKPRRKRAQEVDAAPSGAAEVFPALEAAPKRRGRPRKVVEQLTVQETPAEELVPSEESIPLVEEPLSAVDLLAVDPPVFEQSNGSTPVEKKPVVKRGRPKKQPLSEPSEQAENITPVLADQPQVEEQLSTIDQPVLEDQPVEKKPAVRKPRVKKSAASTEESSAVAQTITDVPAPSDTPAPRRQPGRPRKSKADSVLDSDDVVSPEALTGSGNGKGSESHSSADEVPTQRQDGTEEAHNHDVA